MAGRTCDAADSKSAMLTIELSLIFLFLGTTFLEMTLLEGDFAAPVTGPMLCLHMNREPHTFIWVKYVLPFVGVDKKSISIQ